MTFLKEVFSCKREQLTIRGNILKPETEGKLPTVILSHGFASNANDIKNYAAHFANDGYICVSFDFCGSGRSKSDGDSVDMTLSSEKKDLSTIIDYVKQLDEVDEDHLILAGCSQGGLVSALVAAEREDEIEKLILYYPAFCIPDHAKRGKILGASFDPNNIPETFKVFLMTFGGDYIREAQSLDVYKAACTYKKSVLICHGTKDTIVSLDYAYRAQEEYPNAKLVTIKNGDHGFNIIGFKRAMAATDDFLANQLTMDVEAR